MLIVIADPKRGGYQGVGALRHDKNYKVGERISTPLFGWIKIVHVNNRKLRKDEEPVAMAVTE